MSRTWTRWDARGAGERTLPGFGRDPSHFRPDRRPRSARHDAPRGPHRAAQRRQEPAFQRAHRRHQGARVAHRGDHPRLPVRHVRVRGDPRRADRHGRDGGAAVLHRGRSRGVPPGPDCHGRDLARMPARRRDVLLPGRHLFHGHAPASPDQGRPGHSSHPGHDRNQRRSRRGPRNVESRHRRGFCDPVPIKKTASWAPRRDARTRSPRRAQRWIRRRPRWSSAGGTS